MNLHLKPPPSAITYPRLPAEIEAEQSCLGGCMLRNAIIPRVEAICTPDDFSEALHKRIATAIYSIAKESRPVTPLTVKAYLGTDPVLVEMGDFEYLVNLTLAAGQDTPVAAQVVADTAARREAMIAIWDAQEMLARGDTSIVDILKPVVAAADRAADRDSAKSGSGAVGDAADEFIRSLDSPDYTRGVSTGLSDLDKIIGSLDPGNLYVIAGRPGMGKSAVGVALASAAAQATIPVEYFSLEMPRRQLSARLITELDFDHVPLGHGEYPLQYSRLLRRKHGAHEALRAREAADRARALPITIHDRSSVTMAEITGLARARASRLGELGVVIVDHMHLIRPDDRYRGNQTQELGETVKAAKRLALALKWPVVLLAQLNRQVESRPEKERMPTLADLRQSGEIEEAADVVMFLHRPAYYVERRRPPLGDRDPGWAAWKMDMDPVRHVLNIDVAKNRHGETGNVRVFVDIGANAIRDGREEA